MPTPSSPPLCRAGIVLLAGTALALGPAVLPLTGPLGALAGSAIPAAQAAPVPGGPLLVTEIAPDTIGADEFEFLELTNTSTEPVVVGGEDGHSLSYIYADSADTARDVPLTLEETVEITPGDSLVLWLSYETKDLDSFARTVEEFRTHWGAAEDVPVVRVTGQPGMANGGGRGVRVLDRAGAEVSRSFYPAGSVGQDRSAHFALPAADSHSATLFASAAAPTPGAVDPSQLTPAEPEQPERPEEPAEPEQPEEPADPVDPPAAPPADSLVGHLQITEITPDTTNVDGADGYEFIELYNATTAPISMADYELRYLYTADGESITNAADWPLSPSDAVIEPGGTLVIWVRNGSNDAATAEDFAANYGVDPASLHLVETPTAGMANGSGRGLEIRTRAGDSVHRAFYNLSGADDTQPDQGIQYRTGDGADGAQPDFSRAERTGLAPATPGAVDPSQVSAELVEVPADTQAPEVRDLSPAELDPSADAVISHEVTDDVQARTVTLHLRSSAEDEFTPITVPRTEGDRFDYAIPAADLTGKRWFEYYLVASDGTHETRTEPIRVSLTGVDAAPLRMNLAQGQYVSGTTSVSVAGDEYPASAAVSIDGTERDDVVPALEASPVFAMDVSQTDTFFRNGVLVGDEVISIFDEGTYANWTGHDAEVPLQHVTRGEPLTVAVAAGTKAYPGIDENENNDDFSIRNLRLILPDGRTLRPVDGVDPAEIIAMGDSAGKHDLYDAAFEIPEDAFTAHAVAWDTTAVADGEHVLVGADGDGNRVERTVLVDNTAPAISTGIEDGADYQGSFSLDVSAEDAGSGLASLTVLLDGEEVQPGEELSSLTLDPGEHTLKITAVDELGNEAMRTLTFTTPVEDPTATLLTEGGLSVPVCEAPELFARVTDPSGDPMDVSFRAGTSASLADGTVAGTAGEVRDADAAEREGEALTGGQTTASEDALPFHEFAVDVPEGAGEDAEVHVTWEGSADPGARVRLLVEETAGGELVEVAHAFAAEDGSVAFDEVVPAAGHVAGGQLRAVIQHSVGWSGGDLSSRGDAIAPHHPEATDRSEYDFTLAWESDTQYYNEEFYEHQLNIHEFLLEQREPMNLQYLFHTGDIVDESDKPEQWANANPAYAQLDEAGLPYNVLAGNHDVGHMDGDYTAYSTHFGKHRYEDNPWYGGFYEDNRGSYTLFSAGGVDFIVVSQGWGPGDAEIDWMNEVLAQYPERTAIINLHEYMLTTGGLGPIPQRIQDEVVATNPNVSMVMSGHYHDAHTRVDSFDDDGDGTPDREVTQMLFDYQGLPEGGQGFLRLLHFDNEGERMMVRTFSPSLEQYSSDDATLTPEDQDFEVSYAQLGIEPADKELTTDAFRADVLSSEEFAQVQDVASGEVVEADSAVLGAGTHSWYVRVTDPHGGVARSEVRELTLTGDAAGCEGGAPGDGGSGGEDGAGIGIGIGNGGGAGENGSSEPGDGGDGQTPGTGDAGGTDGSNGNGSSAGADGPGAGDGSSGGADGAAGSDVDASGATGTSADGSGATEPGGTDSRAADDEGSEVTGGSGATGAGNAEDRAGEEQAQDGAVSTGPLARTGVEVAGLAALALALTAAGIALVRRRRA